MFFFKIITVVKFSQVGVSPPHPTVEVLPLDVQKLSMILLLLLELNILNFKRIGLNLFLFNRIPCIFVLYRCVKEITHFELHRDFLSDVHQNLINTKLLCGHCNSRINERKSMKLYIQLHLDII